MRLDFDVAPPAGRPEARLDVPAGAEPKLSGKRELTITR